MKRILAGFVLMVSLAAIAQTDVGVNTVDLTQRKLPKVKVTLTAQFRQKAVGVALVNPDAVSLLTDMNGLCVFSNVVSGPYKVTIAGNPGSTYPINVPTNSGYFEAAELRPDTNPPDVVLPVFYSSLDAAKAMLRGEIEASSSQTLSAAQAIIDNVDQALKVRIGLRIFNVQSYGAKGDGVTDDSAAIRAAWGAWTNAGAGVLYFPAGLYPDTNQYALNTDVYSKVTQGYNLNTFEVAGDGEAASVWLAKITNAAFITMATAVINMHHLCITNAGSGVNTGLQARVVGTVCLRNVAFSGFRTRGSIGADFPLTCGGLIDRCEFNYCDIGLRLPSYADGWNVFATLHYNTVGVMVGGSYPYDESNSVLRAHGVKIEATGHGNGWPVVIGLQSNSTRVSGYYEDSTNCVVAIGIPDTYPDERARETYVGPVQVVDLAGVEIRMPTSPVVKVYATNALSLIMRNIMKGDVAVEFVNPYAETNMMIDIESVRNPVIKLASGRTPQLANVSFDNGAARRVTWNLQEEHFSFRDWTNAYHAALPWGRLRVGERITAKPFASDGVQQAMLYMWTPGASAARLLYGGGSSETKPVSDHWFYTGTPTAAGAGTVVAAIDSAGFKGNGANITNLSTSLSTNLGFATTIDMALPTSTLRLGVNATIVGFQNLETARAQRATRIWTNTAGGNITISWPASVRITHLSSPGSKATVVTNAGIGQADVFTVPGVTTNVYFSTPY